MKIIRYDSSQVEAERQSLITIEKRLKLKEVGDTIGVEQAENTRAERASGAILAVRQHPGVQVALGHSPKLVLKARTQSLVRSAGIHTVRPPISLLEIRCAT